MFTLPFKQYKNEHILLLLSHVKTKSLKNKVPWCQHDEIFQLADVFWIKHEERSIYVGRYMVVLW